MAFVASLFGGGKKADAPAAPQPLPTAPTVEDASAKAEENAKKKRAATSSSKSIYSSPLGIPGEANVARAGLKEKLGQ